MKRVTITVVKGSGRSNQDFGRNIVVDVGHCVMLGRSPDLGGSTGMITAHSLVRLDDEDLKTVARHLKIRAPLKSGARSAFASFERDVDVGFLDDAVSSRHAMVFCDEAGATLLDIGSTNGCFVNGRRVMESDLTTGDLLRLGETRLEVR